MEANLRPIEGAFNSAIEALHVNELGASQQNTLEHDPKLGSRNLPSGLLAMELFKILWDFCFVCLNAPQSLMAGEHCLRGFTNRDIRAQLKPSVHLRACGHDPAKQSAKVSRTFRRLHAHGLIAKIPRTRRSRVTAYGRQVMGTSLYLRD